MDQLYKPVSVVIQSNLNQLYKPVSVVIQSNLIAKPCCIKVKMDNLFYFSLFKLLVIRIKFLLKKYISTTISIFVNCTKKN